jgi:chromosome segregation ATPase
MFDSISPQFLTIISSFITAVLTGVLTYFGVRKKNNNDAFKNLIDANEKFREEIRRDLIVAKQDLLQARDEINKSREHILGLENKIDEYQVEIDSYRKSITALKSEILSYQAVTVKYKEEIHQLTLKLDAYNEQMYNNGKQRDE